jgi:replication fork protection complex subunit Tof1/Swi1
MKLFFRLVKFLPRHEGKSRIIAGRKDNKAIVEEDDDEPGWYVPASLVPSELRRCLNVIDHFLATPYDLQGKKVSDLLRKRRRRRQRQLSPDNDLPDDQDEPRKRKREKKIKEKEQYKSATFIEDSDAEYGDIEAFLEKEKVLRERMSQTAAASGRIGTMKPTGTKKRRKKVEKGAEKKRKGNDESILRRADGEGDLKEVEHSDESDSDISTLGASSPTSQRTHTPERKKPRPRPRPRTKAQPSTQVSPSIPESSNWPSDIDDGPGNHTRSEVSEGVIERSHFQDNSPSPTKTLRKKGRLVISDDE